MRVPLIWLRDWGITADADAVEAALNEAGLEVESREDTVFDAVGGAALAEVRAVKDHPARADLQVLTVEVGKASGDVACPRGTARVGEFVVWAPPGATLGRDGHACIEQLDGEKSEGTLLGAVDLGFADGPHGPWVLGAAPRPGGDLAELLGPEQPVYVIDTGRVRFDLLGMAGIAREVGAVLGETVTPPGGGAAPVHGCAAPPTGPAGRLVVPGDVPVRAAAVTVQDVQAHSCLAVALRLLLAGVRPLNAAVDAAAYATLEYGQPVHAFDLDRMSGARISYRAARPGESIAVAGRTLGLEPADLLLTDGDDVVRGLVGVGPADGAVPQPGTTAVLIEAAAPVGLGGAAAARRAGPLTASAVRAARGCDPAVVAAAAGRAASLLAAQGAAPDTLIEAGTAPPEPATVELSTAAAGEVLGVSCEDHQIRALLEPLGYRCEVAGPGRHRVTVPSWRPDRRTDDDVVEDLARRYGFRKLGDRPSTLTRTPCPLTGYRSARRAVRHALLDAGLTEVICPPLLPSGGAFAHLGRAITERLRIDNPIEADKAELRASLVPGLVAAAVTAGGLGLRLFEIGRTYHSPKPNAMGPFESECVAALLPGATAAEAGALLAAVASSAGFGTVTVTDPGSDGTAPVLRNGRPVGAVGQLDRADVHRGAWWEVELDPFVTASAGDPSRRGPADPVLALTVPDGITAPAAEEVVREVFDTDLALLTHVAAERDAAAPGTRELRYAVRFREDVDPEQVPAMLVAGRAAIEDVLADRFGDGGG